MSNPKNKTSMIFGNNFVITKLKRLKVVVVAVVRGCAMQQKRSRFAKIKMYV